MFRFIILLSLILAVRLVFFYANPPRIETLPKNAFRETTIFSQIKESTKNQYRSILTPDQSDLLMGIVFGEDISYDAKNKFITTGVIHVVAASGMNVSMLTAILLSFFATFLRRQYALLLTGLVVIFYTGLADFQPSIVRAGIMAIFALGAKILGRQNTSIYALFLAAFLMAFIDPNIISSISFQLSFASTLGIIVIDPILKSGFFKSFLFEDFRTTLAAQIATTPLLLFLFGTYSIVSIFANLLVLWTIPPIMLLGMVSATFGFVFPYLASIFTYLSLPLLAYFIFVVDSVSKHAIQFEMKIPITIMIGSYLLVTSIILWITKNKNTK